MVSIGPPLCLQRTAPANKALQQTKPGGRCWAGLDRCRAEGQLRCPSVRPQWTAVYSGPRLRCRTPSRWTATTQRKFLPGDVKGHEAKSTTWH